MPFESGTLSFSRLQITGEAPKTVDADVLKRLADKAFVAADIHAAGETEAGWNAGRHLFDTNFSYESNGYGVAGTSALFSIRIDTHNVPSDVKKSYRRMHEEALCKDNPSGMASKAQRREACDLAEHDIARDLKDGKFKKSKTVPIFWHMPSKTLYVGSSSVAVLELVAGIFRETFQNLDVSLLSSGSLAAEAFRLSGRHPNIFGDLRPLSYTGKPVGSVDQDSEGSGVTGPPLVPWVAVNGDMKDFLGNEFMLWLWWWIANNEGLINAQVGSSKSELAIVLDKTLDMECAWGVSGKQSLRGPGPGSSPEAKDALRIGKWPRKASMLLSDGEHQWGLTLQADKWAFSGVTLPQVAEAQSMRDLVEARLDLIIKLAETVDALYGEFIKLRTNDWTATHDLIHDWATGTAV